MNLRIALTAAAALTLPATGLPPTPAPVPAMTDRVEIREWPVPWENSRPRDPYVGPDGRVWFVGQRGDYVAYLDPGSDQFHRYPLDPGTGPHNLIVQDDGTIWFAGNAAAYIGKLDPATGAVTKFPMPDPQARDPHTLVFDGRGHIWFTVQGGNFVGRLDRSSGDIRLVQVPTPRARPYGILVDPQGQPWIAEFGTYKIGTVDPTSFEYEEIELPRQEARPRRIVRSPDSALWYVDYAQGFLGRLDPTTQKIREWPVPAGGDSRPYGMAIDDRGRIWFVETGPRPNRMVGFDPSTGEFFSITEIESGAGAVRNMYFHAPTRTVWFGTDANTIGRVQIP